MNLYSELDDFILKRGISTTTARGAGVRIPAAACLFSKFLNLFNFYTI